MKNLGVAGVILGIKITKTSDGYALSQTHYVEKILKKFSKIDNDLARTLIDENLHLYKNNGEIISQLEYSQIIDSLMYLMNYTPPNIAYTINRLSRYTSNLGSNH